MDQERIVVPHAEPGQQNYGATDLPPAYNVYDTEAGARGPPPSYESLYGQIREAHTGSTGGVDFIWKVLKIILSTIGCTILIGFIVAIPISMIVMGAIYFNDCPREKYIPIYLLVGGSFGIVKNLFDFCRRAKNQHDHNDDDSGSRTRPFDSILSCFLAVWFITGSVWIYRIYNDYDPVKQSSRPDHFCAGPLYLYAFWLTTATYIFMILFGFCVVLCGCVAILFKDDE